MPGQRHAPLPVLPKLFLRLLLTQVALFAVLGVAAAESTSRGGSASKGPPNATHASGDASASTSRPLQTFSVSLPPTNTFSSSFSSITSIPSTSAFSDPLASPQSSNTGLSDPASVAFSSSSSPISLSLATLTSSSLLPSDPTSLPASPYHAGPTTSDLDANTKLASPASTPSTPASAAFAAPSKSNHTAIFAGVIVPVVLILLGIGGFVLYKRRRRSRDRRAWERTHEEIADAVRQVGSPVPSGGASRGMSPWTYVEHPLPPGTSGGFVMHERDGSGDATSAEPLNEDDSAESSVRLSKTGRSTPYSMGW